MSLNDPQWGNRGSENGGGKRPNQGPPDLEDLWRDLNRRLSGVFDKNKGGSNGGGVPERRDGHLRVGQRGRTRGIAHDEA